MPESMMARIAATLYEPQLRKLPEYGKLLFDHLCAEYSQLIGQRITPDEREEIERIKRSRANDGLAWRDIYNFEQTLIRYLDLADLRRKIKTLRGQFRNVAGSKEYDVYIASKPPDLETETQEERLRQDCQFLLNEFYLRYALLSAREHMRNNLLKIAALMAIVSLVIGAVFAYANFNEKWANMLGWEPGVTTVAVVMFAGIVGALTSMQQRIQSAAGEGDPIYLFSMLTHGRFGIFMSPISGAIFSIALYLMFAGGLLSGKIFPTIVTSEGSRTEVVSPDAPAKNPATTPTPAVSPMASPSASPSIQPTPLTSQAPQNSRPAEVSMVATSAPKPKKEPVLLNKFLIDTGPASGVDFALLVIWAFIAGFAERFVPDALNRLIPKDGVSFAK